MIDTKSPELWSKLVAPLGIKTTVSTKEEVIALGELNLAVALWSWQEKLRRLRKTGRELEAKLSSLQKQQELAMSYDIMFENQELRTTEAERRVLQEEIAECEEYYDILRSTSRSANSEAPVFAIYRRCRHFPIGSEVLCFIRQDSWMADDDPRIHTFVYGKVIPSRNPHPHPAQVIVETTGPVRPDQPYQAGLLFFGESSQDIMLRDEAIYLQEHEVCRRLWMHQEDDKMLANMYACFLEHDFRRPPCDPFDTP